jgi:protein farnesyltransferase subunit beta
LIEKCFDRFEQLSALDPSLPFFYRKEHIRFLERCLRFLSTGYECLDASRPWLVYWILQSAHCLNFKFSHEVLTDVIHFLKNCRHPNGGFAGGPNQYPHLAPTYAAVLALCLIETDESFEAIDFEGIKNFLWSVRTPNGAFRMHVDGEIDVRGAYCAVTVARLSGISPNNKLFEGTANWIATCQTYEGGFGGSPNLEAHGGYSFCAAAALALLGNTSTVNLKTLLRWSVNRQMKYEGGFQGRTNKLVDGCYSFWQGGLVQVIQMLIEKTTCRDGYTINIDELLFNRTALQEYILICCQKPNGGLIDKPGKPEDLYHTCYTLSGLSIAQNFNSTKQPIIIGNPDTNEVLATHPLYNISPKSVMKAYIFAQQHPVETEEDLITTCNGEATDDQNDQ